ncbi:hypothetical protein BST61_g7257 [Cercospora zeina]
MKCGSKGVRGQDDLSRDTGGTIITFSNLYGTLHDQKLFEPTGVDTGKNSSFGCIRVGHCIPSLPERESSADDRQCCSRGSAPPDPPTNRRRETRRESETHHCYHPPPPISDEYRQQLVEQYT